MFVLLFHDTKDPDPLSGTVVRQTDFDVTIGQCAVSDKNLARAILIRHKKLFDGETIATVCFVSATVVGQCFSSGP